MMKMVMDMEIIPMEDIMIIVNTFLVSRGGIGAVA